MGKEALAKLRILIVDDEVHTRRLLRSVLEQFGFRDMHEAVDGTTAWDRLVKYGADLIFCDMEMRPVGGIAFTRRVRTDPESPNPTVPIIMLSGHNEEIRVHKALEAGVDEYIVKPFSPKLILDHINSLRLGTDSSSSVAKHVPGESEGDARAELRKAAGASERLSISAYDWK